MAVRCSLKISPARADVIPTSVCTEVRKRYTVNGSLICPISGEDIRATGDSIDHSHIIPKCYRKIFMKGELDGADNIIPTFPALHRQMELYQHQPTMSFEFLSHDDESYDWYQIIFSHKVNNNHILHRYIKQDKVRLHRLSRKHLHIHLLVFKDCEDTIKTVGNDWTRTLQELNKRHAVTGILRSIFGAIRNVKTGMKISVKSAVPVTASVINSWVESGEIVVRGELWSYENEEAPTEIRCKILRFHEKKKMMELLCPDDYADDDVEYFLQNYNARSGVLKRSLSNFEVWKVPASTLMPFVLRVGQDKSSAWIQVQEEIPIGTLFHNFVHEYGFALMEVLSYDDSNKLCKVKVINPKGKFDDLDFTMSQIQRLVSGNISEGARSCLLNKCVLVKSSETDDELQFGKLLQIEHGYAVVQWLRENAVHKRRQNPLVKTYYPAYWSNNEEVVAAKQPFPRSWRPFKSQLPISHLWGKPFELVDNRVPYDVTSMAMFVDLKLSAGKQIGTRVLRTFDGDQLEGAVCSYFPESDGGVELFHITYIDGDGEDLNSSELDELRASNVTNEAYKWKSVDGVERQYIGKTFVDVTLSDDDEFKLCTVVDVVQNDEYDSKFFRRNAHSGYPCDDLLETTQCEEFPPFKSSGSDFEWTVEPKKKRRTEN